MPASKNLHTNGHSQAAFSQRQQEMFGADLAAPGICCCAWPLPAEAPWHVRSAVLSASPAGGSGLIRLQGAVISTVSLLTCEACIVRSSRFRRVLDAQAVIFPISSMVLCGRAPDPKYLIPLHDKSVDGRSQTGKNIG